MQQPALEAFSLSREGHEEEFHEEDAIPELGSEAAKSLMSDLMQSIPGIDEAMSFAELMKYVQVMEFSCIVFDTAPTGHTLRLLSFPTVLQKGLDKLIQLKSKFSGVFDQFNSLFNLGVELGQLAVLAGGLLVLRRVPVRLAAYAIGLPAGVWTAARLLAWMRG